MAVYLDEFTIWKTFLDGILAEMHRALICDDNLLPEVNTVTKFLVYVIRYEQSAHTATHYDQRSSHCAQGHCQPVKVGTFLVKRSEMDQNCNPRFVVRRKLSPGQKPVQGPTDCKVPKAQLQAAHTAAADSDAESDVEEDQEELVKDEEVPPEEKDLKAEYDTESVHIDGDEYVMVDVYDNEYYTHKEDEEHLFALTEYQGDTCVQMQHVTLQKAADKLHRPQYTPQEKECLVTYVEVNEYSAWTLWDSGSTTTGITPQFAHVNAIHVHELSEQLMLQLGTVGSHAMVQFGVEVEIRALGHPTKEYVDIANFDRYDMIIEGRKNATKEDSVEKLAPMASLPANSQAISEEEFRGTLKRGDGLDQSITNDRKAVIKPDKAQLLKKTRVK
ncbi:hypothetical protein C0995_008625 [Termitomyces sp. Mi166|nr:hypothetical protein C0995_008625 [Termitomyces sp. Mi166\